MRVRHRLSKPPPWLRQAWCGRARRGPQQYESRLCSFGFDRAGIQLAFDEAFDTVLAAGARRDPLDRAIEQVATTEPCTGVVSRLGCLREMSILARCRTERRDGGLAPLHRGDHRVLPGAGAVRDSSGSHRMQGSIIKTANSPARRLLAEAAW